MRILITTQVFPPEIHPSARIVWELAHALREAGHVVNVATGFPHHPHGRLLGAYRKRLLLREEDNGIRILRGWHLTSPSPSIPIRGLVYISQALGTLAAAIAARKPDLVINFGPPLVGPLFSLMAAKCYGVPQVTVVYDLYPDVAIEAGAIRNGMLIRMAKALEQWVYENSDRIVVLSEGFRETFVERKGVPARKVRVIPAWIDTEEIRRVSGAGVWRDKHDIPRDAFVVLYAGTIGLVSGAEVMVEVARMWAGIADALFLFVGEGKSRDKVREEAEGLPNVRFLDFQPREDLPAMLSSANVGVMTLLPGRGRTSVPSKVLGYMAVELPVLVSCDRDSDSARMIREARCGEVVPPADAKAISEALKGFYSDRAQWRDAGRRGRMYLETHHSRKAGTTMFQELAREFA